MTENVFRSKEEELQRLIQEISEVKSQLKEISSSVGRIERHVKRSFGIPPKPKATKIFLSKGNRKQDKEKPSISPEQSLKIFDELSAIWDREKPQAVEERLQEMSIPDLKIIAQELGITFPSKPSKKLLFSGIIGRLNETAMLSKNINNTPSLREQMQGVDNKE